MEAVGRRGNDGSHRRSIGCGLNDVSKNQAFYQALLLTASVIAREVQGDIIQRSFSLAFSSALRTLDLLFVVWNSRALR